MSILLVPETTAIGVDDHRYRIAVSLNQLINASSSTGWKDMLAPLSTAGVPNQNAPTLSDFTVGTVLRREYRFAIGDYLYMQPFHVNHDVKPGGQAFLHMHWTTDGTSTAAVRWEFQILRALGHNQAPFTQEATRFVEQAGSGVAYQHMVTEVAPADAMILSEPDELILVTVRRVTNGGTDNTDDVFGLMCDLHYESDRDATPQKAPDFYTP